MNLWKRLRWWWRLDVLTLPFNIARAFSIARATWGHQDCGHEVVFLLMAWQLRRIRAHVAEGQRCVGWERDVRSMDITVHLLERLEADDYYAIADVRYPERTRSWAQFSTLLARQDIDMLCNEIRRHAYRWGD